MSAASVVIASAAWANGGGSDDWEEDRRAPTFALTTASIGGAKAARGAPSYLASSRIAAVGDGALASDADSGQLILTDAEGASVAQLAIGNDAALLAYDDTARRAYVADRRGDRVVVVDVGDAALAIAATWRTPAEPYGIALTPDRATVLVTTIADRMLVAFDVRGREQWRAALAPEPRGLAVSPDGARVVVASLSTGAVDQFDLGESPRARRVALPAFTAHSARGAFAVAFIGEQVVVPYQLSVPIARQIITADHYGGGFESPITQHVAWLGRDGRQALAQMNVVEPRAIGWNAKRDVMYLAGMASDHVVAVPKASQVDPAEPSTIDLGPGCGADGLAITRSGRLLVWCSFTRSIARFDRGSKARRGPELVASTLDADSRAGRSLFHSATEHLSSKAAFSCASCHLDGRSDGLSWRIQGTALQTPLLVGRLAGTAPYKWDGKAADLSTSIRSTVKRLGGEGLSKRDVAFLVRFLETMPAPRVPTRDRAAVARGKALFESAELGCTTCHDGPALTDQETHNLAGNFDTPGLGGLAASAPYFHDGSAVTLEAVIQDRGRVHGMATAATRLAGSELSDLVAFLETR